jgi:hypothetical protein
VKRFNNDLVNGYNDKPIEWNIDGKLQELKLSNVMTIILNFLHNNGKMTTQKDSIEGAKLAIVLDKIIKEPNQVIELEDSNHYWFYNVAERFTPMLFGVNGNHVYTAIKDGWIKENKANVKGGK